MTQISKTNKVGRKEGRKEGRILSEMKHIRTKTDTPTTLFPLHCDEFILKRRPHRQGHRAEPPRICIPIIHRRELDRFRRIPAAERGNRACEQDRLSERRRCDDVESHRDGGNGGGAGRWRGRGRGSRVRALGRGRCAGRRDDIVGC